MNKEQLSQLVQDVINGKEKPLKALLILSKYKVFIDDCLEQIDEYMNDDECDATESDLY